jgi:hypothetical protein
VTSSSLVDDELRTMASALVDEFAGVVSPGRVLLCVYRCRYRLLQTGIRQGLVPATEAAARITLLASLPRQRTA